MNARIQVEHPVTEAVTRRRPRRRADCDRRGAGIAPGARRILARRAVPSNAASTPKTRRTISRPARAWSKSVQLAAGEGIRVDTHIVSRQRSCRRSTIRCSARSSRTDRDRGAALARLRRRAGDDTHRGRRTAISHYMPTCWRTRSSRRRRRYGVSGAPAEPARAHSGESWLTCSSSRLRCATATSACGRRAGHRHRPHAEHRAGHGRVGYKAIDFTTSTHMGVAVRYKREDPWERIRLMAEATPRTPLQFMSTGFRFISWETASPEFMALAFRSARAATASAASASPIP